MIEKVRIKGYRIFDDIIIKPNPGLNIIIGDNESGKSTLLEAINLSLTGRVNSKRAIDELNPFWFHQQHVKDYYSQKNAGQDADPPEILVELYFTDKQQLQSLRGVCNSLKEDCPGISLKVSLDPDFSDEFDKFITEFLATDTFILPAECYAVNWRTFSGHELQKRPKELNSIFIDSTTGRSIHSTDYHTKQLLGQFMETGDRAKLSIAYRTSKEKLAASPLLSALNLKLGTSTLHKDITIGVDHSSRSSWESSITPHISSIPFSMAGLGRQATTKIALAMTYHASDTNIVLIEEPENHLSYTKLNELVQLIGSLKADDQQLFITTHSSFILNRLGLNQLILMSYGKSTSFTPMEQETTRYFMRLPGYDTLRLVLADRVVLVEGPSDEMLFNRLYSDMYRKRPIEDGVDVYSMRGLSLKHCLTLRKMLDKKTAVIRDNDGKKQSNIETALDGLLSTERALFVGDPKQGTTLEPQVVECNDPDTLRRVLGITERADLLTWMTNSKTEAALRIAEHNETIKYPGYLTDAAVFIKK